MQDPVAKQMGLKVLYSAQVSLRTRIGVRPGKQANLSAAGHGCRGVEIEILETDLQICRLFTLA